MCGRPGPGFGLEDACLGARPSFSLSQTLSVPLSRHHWEQHDHPHPPCPSVDGTLSAYLPPSLVVRDECVIALSQNARGTEPDVQRGPSWPVGAPLPVPPPPCLLPPSAPAQVPAFSPSSHCSDPLQLHSFPQGPELTQGPGR